MKHNGTQTIVEHKFVLDVFLPFYIFQMNVVLTFNEGFGEYVLLCEHFIWMIKHRMSILIIFKKHGFWKYISYMFLCFVTKVLVDYAFERKMIKWQQRFIHLRGYESLIRAYGELTPSACLELWINFTFSYHWELGLGTPLAAATQFGYSYQSHFVAISK